MNQKPKEKSLSKTFLGAAAGGVLGASASLVDNASGVIGGSFLPLAGVTVGAVAGAILARLLRKNTNVGSAAKVIQTDDAVVQKTEEIDLMLPAAALEPSPVEREIKNVVEADVLSHIDNTATKMHLARSYIELEDLELASSILGEVLQDQQSICADVLTLMDARQQPS